MNKNLIILMIDAGRFDRASKSKFFKSIQEKSACFLQSVTYGPHTIASMHAVFSGSYGNRTGTNSYWSTFKFKKNKFKTLTEYLKEQNYYTCAEVVNELVLPKQGFDEFTIYDEKENNIISRHINLLKKMKSHNDHNKNFFLYVQYAGIHATIIDEVLKAYDNFSKEYFDNKEKNKKRYDHLFKNAENYLKNILDEIKILNLDQNSLILIMSDHGMSTGEKIGERAYGVFCYDYTLRTFTYFLSSDIQPIKIKQQVRTIDFMPTILDYLQIETDSAFSKMDGQSLIPLINGKTMSEKIAFSETGNPLKEKAPPKEPNVKSVRTSKWKLIWNIYDNTKEFYNLETDPDERNNLSGKNLPDENLLWLELKKINENTT
jgi:arylsulfatase A-like enzyme